MDSRLLQCNNTPMNGLLARPDPIGQPMPTPTGPLPPPARRRFRALELAPSAPEGEPFRSRDGRALQFRPIRPDDVDALSRLFKRLSPEEIRMRFLYALNELSHVAAQRFCTLESAHEAAFVLMDHSVEPAEMRGVGRIYADETTRSAEFAVLVERSWTGRGLGAFLIRQLIAECRRRDLDEIWGQVLIENRPMLDLCEELGFHRRLMADEPGTALITLQLH
jgi:RimJ/RimL family protein N-acetyltransferase